MVNTKLLIQEKHDLLLEGTALMQKAKTEGREMTGVEQARFEVIKRQIAGKNREILEEEERFARENPGKVTRRHYDLDASHVVPGTSEETNGSALSNGGFASIGDFMGSLFRKTKGDFDERLRLQAASITNENDDAGGGYAVPPQFLFNALQPDWDEGAGEVLLNLCDRIPMASNELNCPGFADASHASTAPYGITWLTLGEGDNWGNSQALPFKKIILVAKKTGALFAVSNEWLADASGVMQQRIQQIFTTSLRWYIENRLWNGGGAGEPLGVLNGSGILSIPKETGQLPGTIQTENIVNMWARLRPGSHSRAIWVANPTTFPQLATLTVGVGTGGALTGLLQPNTGVAGGPATAIFGRPLYLAEHLPALGTVGDIVLLDPKLYMFGDRQQVTMDASQHFTFNYDETTFRVKARFDGQPTIASVLTPYKGTTVAWAVSIATR